MSRSYTSSPPQEPPWRVEGLLYFFFTLCFNVTLFYIITVQAFKHVELLFLSYADIHVNVRGRPHIRTTARV
jgi:hypothetical protein